MSWNSARERSDASKRAEPPPERRNSRSSSSPSPWTSSKARSDAAKEAASATGCPASKISRPGRGPWLWPYFVTTNPPSTLTVSRAAEAIRHAAFPTDTNSVRPEGGRKPSRASFTATSGKARRRAVR